MLGAGTVWWMHRSQPAKLVAAGSAAPVAPSAPPAPAQDAAPAAVQAVSPKGTLRWLGRPRDAQISIDQHPVGRADDGSVAIELDGRAHNVKITAPGYRSHSLTVEFGQDQAIDVQLEKLGNKPTSSNHVHVPQGATTANGSPVETGI